MASDLRSELRSRAERTAQSLMDEARAEADRIAAQAERQIEQTRRSVLQSKERELRTEAHAKVASAQHTAMQDVLVANATVVSRVLDEARKRLAAARRSAAYLSTLQGDLQEALAFVEEQIAVVQCPRDLEPIVRDAVRGMPNLSVEANDEIGSGFKVIGDGGSVVVDGTLEARLDRLAPTLAIEIYKLLDEA